MKVLCIKLLALFVLLTFGACAPYAKEDRVSAELPILRGELLRIPGNCIVGKVEGTVEVGDPKKGSLPVEESQKIRYGLFYYISSDAVLEIQCANTEKLVFNRAPEQRTVIFRIR